MSVQNILTQLQNNTNRINYSEGQKNLGKSNFDQRAFLQLLMAKLQNQDPTNPENTDAFLTQQAQLTQVETLNNVLKVVQNTSNITQASSLINKKVDIRDGNASVTGIVTDAKFDGTSAAITVNDKTYKLDQVTRIYGGA